MKFLALDTATEACAVAVMNNGEVLERRVLGRQHAERVLETIDDLLMEAAISIRQLDGIAFGRGPGMFTGLRIGAGVVQGIAFAADLPVVPVSSLLALAQGQAADHILAAFDARMGQVYWGCYVRNADDWVEPAAAERVDAPGVIAPPAGHWLGVGSGWDVHATAMLGACGNRVHDWRAQCFPAAGDIARIGERELLADRAVAAERAVPVYVRDDVARKPG